MTLNQFNRCDEMEQLEAIWEHGVKVAEREDDINRFNLYQIDAFYVDGEFHKEYNVHRDFYSFSSSNSDNLQPYFGKIDLNGIP